MHEEELARHRELALWPFWLGEMLHSRFILVNARLMHRMCGTFSSQIIRWSIRLWTGNCLKVRASAQNAPTSIKVCVCSKTVLVCQLSSISFLVCYYQALEDVYTRFCDKLSKNNDCAQFGATSHDYFVFHAPYNKLVQKSYGRLFFLDARRASTQGGEGAEIDGIAPECLTKPIQETYTDKALESTLKRVSAEDFDQRLSDANAASKLVGNTYTASVFLGLASLVDRAGSRGDLSPGKSIAVFSYGSGAMATMYRLSV